MIAALYIRVSSAEQTKGYSLEAQEELLRSYASAHDMTVYKLYADEGKSASKALSKRTALLEMVKDAEAKRFTRILFKDVTRWSRRSADYYAIQERLDKCGCSWIAVEQPYLETVTQNGRFLVSVMLGTAQLESENNSQRVRFVQQQMIRNGVVPYGRNQAPFGYAIKKIDGMRRLVKDPEKSSMVEDMFKHLRDHRNAAQTRQYMLEQYGINFTATYFSKVMKNEVYIGRYRGTDGFCEPYITEQQHDELVNWSNRFRRAVHSQDYMFRQILRCKQCGRAMQGSYIAYKDADRIYYRCPKCYMEHQCSMTANVRQDRLEQYLLDTIRPAFDAYKYKVEFQRTDSDNSERIATLRKKLSRLTEVYVDGAIDREKYETRRNALNDEISALSAQTSDDTERLEMLLNQPWETLYRNLDRFEDRAEFWRTLLKAVYFDGSDFFIEFNS